MMTAIGIVTPCHTTAMWCTLMSNRVAMRAKRKWHRDMHVVTHARREMRAWEAIYIYQQKVDARAQASKEAYNQMHNWLYIANHVHSAAVQDYHRVVYRLTGRYLHSPLPPSSRGFLYI